MEKGADKAHKVAGICSSPKISSCFIPQALTSHNLFMLKAVKSNGTFNLLALSCLANVEDKVMVPCV